MGVILTVVGLLGLITLALAIAAVVTKDKRSQRDMPGSRGQRRPPPVWGRGAGQEPSAPARRIGPDQTGRR